MLTINMQATGNNIKNLRKLNNNRLQDLVDVCGVTPVAICKWQSGKTLPTIDNLVILASLWGVKIDDIIVTDTV